MTTANATAPAKKAAAAKPEKKPEFKKQLDYAGEWETIDVSQYSTKIQCAEPECKNVRYCKPQDVFQVKFCKPHAKKNARSSKGKAEKKATKSTGKAARRQAEKAAAPAESNGTQAPTQA